MDVAKMKVVDLRAELTKRGLDSKGNKPVLMERLRQALDEEKGNTDDRSKKSSENEEEESEPEETRRPPPRTPSRSSSRRSATPTKTPTRSSRAAAATAKARLVTVDEDEEPERPKEEKAHKKEPAVEAEEEKPTRKTRRRTEVVPSETTKKLSTPEPEEVPAQKKSERSKSTESKAASPSKGKSAEPAFAEKKHEEPVAASPPKKSVPAAPSDKVTESNVTSSPKKATEAVVTSPQKKPAESVAASPPKKAVESAIAASPKKVVEPVVSPVKKSEEPVTASPKKVTESPAKKVTESPTKKVTEPVVTESPTKKVTEPVVTGSPAKKVVEPVVVTSPAKKVVESVVASPKKVAEPAVTSPVSSPQKSIPQVVVTSPAEDVSDSVMASPQKSVVCASPKKETSEPALIAASPQKSVAFSSPKKETPEPALVAASPQKPTIERSPLKRSAEPVVAPSPPKRLSDIGAFSQKSAESSPKKVSHEHEHDSNVDPVPIPSPQKKDLNNARVSEGVPSDEKQDLPEEVQQPEDVSMEQNPEVETPTDEDNDEKMAVDEEESCDAPTNELTNDTEEMSEAGNDQNVEMKEDTVTENDGKRKRLSSSSEEITRTPPVLKPEDEPEIDSSATLLSWYDSDLNLVINKEGFVSATPMNGDGFCYMWAGARASYGFNSGKVFYEVRIDENCPVNAADEECPHALRAGWSAGGASLQLGEEKFTYAYGENGTKSTDNEFTEYGPAFGKGDIVGCYADFTTEDNITLSFTMNGTDAGVAFLIPKEELGDRPLFPHVLSKNCSFSVNFGQEERWAEKAVEGFVPVGLVEEKDRVAGPQRPEKKEDCEVIMMCGLPSSGKTFWATKYSVEHPELMYNILGTSSFIEKMKISGVARKQKFQGRWETLIEKCTRALNKIMDLAFTRRRNYIIDQTNVYPSAQRRKIRNFYGFKRRAVVVVPSEDEYKTRLSQRNVECRDLPETTLMEMKASFAAPSTGDPFDVVEWAELDEQEGKKVIEGYNTEGKSAGYGNAQHGNKRSRVDKDGRDNRDGRNNRDSRDHRRFTDNRNRNSPWRAGNAGWQNRSQRGSHARHSTGYGNSPGNWRSRGGNANSSHRGGGNDRNRTPSHRPGNWNQSNYQGSQGSNYSRQSNARNNQSSSWGWAGRNNRKPYQQNSYGGQGYYDTGNWHWNQQQYYNQSSWNQQQSETTPTAGGQAVSKK